MSSLENLISDLRSLFDHEGKIRGACTAQSPQLPSFQELVDLQRQQLELIKGTIEKRILDFLRMQPQHARHFGKLGAFHADGGYDESVFIITKFPEGDSAADAALTRVINAVARAIRRNGFAPRIASDCDYHPAIWDNVELHLLGCRRAIAIVEDRYKPELNPNVAMEWGWMRAMGKDVLYLVEERFGRRRADWAGLSEAKFSWSDPQRHVGRAVKRWLSGSGERF